jgi:hypothetical protein
MLDPITPQVLGPFAANVLATAVLPDGLRYGQFEESRQNQQVYSAEKNIVVWTKGAMTVTPDDINNPAGAQTADKLTPTVAASTHYVRDFNAVTNTVTYCFTEWGKAGVGGYDWLCLQCINSVPANCFAYFDVANGVLGNVGAGCTAAIVPFNDGWYMCTIKFTATATANTRCDTYVASANGVLSYAGDAVKHVHVWNSQFEAGDFPSSPIVTAAAGVTRAADVFSWDESDVPQEVKSGAFAFNYIPFHSQAEMPGAGVVWQSKLDANSGWFFDGIATTFEVWDGGKQAESNVMTFPRYDILTETIDGTAGSVTLAGAAGGNGTGALTGAWDWSDMPTFPIGNGVQISGLVTGYRRP